MGSLRSKCGRNFKRPVQRPCNRLMPFQALGMAPNNPTPCGLPFLKQINKGRCLCISPLQPKLGRAIINLKKGGLPPLFVSNPNFASLLFELFQFFFCDTGGQRNIAILNNYFLANLGKYQLHKLKLQGRKWLVRVLIHINIEEAR